jgi:hypothetical protein
MNTINTLILLLLSIVLILLSIKKIEHFDLNNELESNTVLTVPDIMVDPLFENLTFYINDEDPYKKGGKLGLEKCFDNCIGSCVEFGITGNAFCFPNY